jgi:lipid II:glycine glycyltransferase (peptidoglycan interpeptide bridge formation enzyme)
MLNSVWQTEVDRSTSAEWSQMLDLFDDANFYQTWSYGAVRWGEKSLSHLVLKRGGDVLGMAQLRIVRPTRFNFGMAYLRWGPLFERRGRPVDPEVADNMARALEEEYIDKRKLFLRILPNAFVGSPRAAVIQSAFREFTPEPLDADNTDRTLVLDLEPSIDELCRKLEKKWRNQLTSSQKKGLNVVAGTRSEEYRIFCQIYKQMRKRKAFETAVDIEEFGRMQETLPKPQRMRILLSQDKGTPVAGLVASAMGDSAVYLLGATSDEGLNSKGAYLLQWTLIKWLKENGFRWYDLGGINPERNPGVYHFKKGLSGVDICRVGPMVACRSVVSSAIVRTSLAMQGAIRRSKAALRSPWPFKQPAPEAQARSV